MINVLHYLRCPNCGESLTRVEKSLICPNRHAFDLAKSGYVNLLPPGKGKNARTGDDRGMVEARADFLRRGFYDPISEKVAALAAANAPILSDVLSVCDMGSGEGWHSCLIAEKAGALSGSPTMVLGIDASKYAADRACRLARRKGLLSKDGVGAPQEGNVAACFIPANIFHAPLAEASFGAAVSMFAPVAWEEARRILDANGVLIVVSSGREHLLEMRRIIYSDVRLSEEENPDEKNPAEDSTRGFETVCKSALRYVVELPDKTTIANLFMMTPFYYKTTEIGKLRLLSQDALRITVDVNYAVYRKR